jgi:hypothetical protein
VDDLVNLHYPVSVLGAVYMDWLDLGIEGSELACPIGPNFLFSMDVAAFHTVRPLYLGMHPREYRIDVTGVEIAVSIAENFAFVGH